MTPAAADKVLVATEAVADAEVIRKSLEGEFGAIACSCNPDRAAADFDLHQPGLLILAFDCVAKAEQYYLALFRHSQSISARPHRTILLCNKDEVRSAYDLCRKECFDDYVLYWPVTFDPPRLAMSVRLAVRHLAATRGDATRQRQLAEMAREVAEVEPLLDRAMARSDRYLIAADEALRSLADGIGAAVQDVATGLTERLGVMQAGSGMIREVKRHLRMLKDERVLPQVHEAAQAIAPARDSLAAASAAYRPRLASARKLAADLASGLPSILIVEDEETQRQIYRHLLDRSRYLVTFASSGAEALRVASRAAPDLILMDMMLPDLTGVEVTRRLKSVDQLAAVPIVMITGRSERDVVMESLDAGAADFLVKPFTPQSLQQKVEQYVDDRALAPA